MCSSVVIQFCVFDDQFTYANVLQFLDLSNPTLNLCFPADRSCLASAQCLRSHEEDNYIVDTSAIVQVQELKEILG